MAGPGICVLCLADTCTSEVHPVFNHVAPYGYLLSDMYLFMADITNPDFLVLSCRTWIGLDITRFCEQQRQPSSGSAWPACSTIWSPNASETNIDKLQIVQNTALRIATGCTHDTNTQHLHDETNVLPIHQHLQLHASQIRQKAQHPTHPLHQLTIHPHTLRLKKQTTFNNINCTTNIDTHPDTVTQQQISANSTQIHTSIVQTHLLQRNHN